MCEIYGFHFIFQLSKTFPTNYWIYKCLCKNYELLQTNLLQWCTYYTRWPNSWKCFWLTQVRFVLSIQFVLGHLKTQPIRLNDSWTAVDCKQLQQEVCRLDLPCYVSVKENTGLSLSHTCIFEQRKICHPLVHLGYEKCIMDTYFPQQSIVARLQFNIKLLRKFPKDDG